MTVMKYLSLALTLLCLPIVMAAQDIIPTQPASVALPASYQLTNVTFEWQLWNNCGPATLTTALTFFGYADRQDRAADWLKPRNDDANVSPWQMAQFVNDHVTELGVQALVRYGGTRDVLKSLVAHDFPVIIEEGYDPPGSDQGWMGHYLFIKGYDDAQSVFYTHDSYRGPDKLYTYDEIDTFWQHFNYTYIVLFPADRQEEMLRLLGDDADEQRNIERSFERAQREALADNKNAFAWFNIGTNLTMLGQYEKAAIAYDQARSIGLPWRMMWYQFGPFEAYYHVGRYDDMLTLAQSNLNDGGGHLIEETFYYSGLAYKGKGDNEQAQKQFTNALAFNSNFTPAQEALDALMTGTTTTDANS